MKLRALVACFILLICAPAFGDDLWKAICTVESSNNPYAYNSKENAAGIAQITPICVVDCNRIIGYEKWTLADRYDPKASHEMFKLYTAYYKRYYGLKSDEAAARIWNGGPTGWKKRATHKYWRKVSRELRTTRMAKK